MIVVFYVLDSLRADFLSCYGHYRETSPHMDALAKDGVIFTNAFAQSTWTRPSGACLLTSTYASVHGVETMEGRVPESIPTLPKILQEKGFMTVGISSMGNISVPYGFGNGFDRYVELYKDSSLAGKRQKFMVESAEVRSELDLEADYVTLATAEDINDRLIPLIRENKERDVFVFVWSIDTHDPYFHRDRSLSRFAAPSDRLLWVEDVLRMKSSSETEELKALYEDMIFFNDHHIGRLVEELKTLGLYDETLFVVTGDHGEAFGEHGTNSHAGLPFNEQAGVPLILKLPGAEGAGMRIDALVQHIDIGRTIVDYVETRKKGSPSEGGADSLLQGASMLPLLSGQESINDFALCETQPPGEGPLRYVGVKTLDYKYIECFGASDEPTQGGSILKRFSRRRKGDSAHRMLYALRDDPRELRNIAGERKKVVKDFQALLADLLDKNKELAKRFAEGGSTKAKLDEETAKQLKALGYFD